MTSRRLLTSPGRPDLNLALTKLHLFRLSSLLSTLIYLDADVLPLRPLSHLFTITSPHILSACPDTGWPDCFNSGVMVIRPRESDWTGLRELLKNGEGSEGIYSAGNGNGNGSFDGADQGLLNEWFSEEGGGGDWNRLSFTWVCSYFPPHFSAFLSDMLTSPGTMSPLRLRTLTLQRTGGMAVRSTRFISSGQINLGRTLRIVPRECHYQKAKSSLMIVGVLFPRWIRCSL